MTTPHRPAPPCTVLRVPGRGSVELTYAELATLAAELPDQLDRAADEEFRYTEALVDPAGHGLAVGGEADLSARRRIWWTPGSTAPQPLGVPVLQFISTPRHEPGVRGMRRAPLGFDYRWQLVFSRLPEQPLASCPADDPGAFAELVATSRGDVDALATLLSLACPDFPRYLGNEVLSLARPEVVAAVRELLRAAAAAPEVELPRSGVLAWARPVVLDPELSVAVELSSAVLIEVGPYRVAEVDGRIRDAGLVPLRDGMRPGSWFSTAYRMAVAPGFGARLQAAIRAVPVDAVTLRMQDEDTLLTLMSVASMFGIPEQPVLTMSQWATLRRRGAAR